MKAIQFIIVSLLVLGHFLFPDSTRADEKNHEETINFSREILPVLSDKCFACHGPDATKKRDLRLDSYAAATRDLGGYKAINPDHPEQSEIIARLNDADDPMPPKDAEKQLSSQERKLLEAWVRQGGAYASHWAFVPPRKESPGNVENIPARDIIDAFVLQQLDQRNITIAPEADRPALARRAALVLTGLPPEPGQLRDFLEDSRPDAYERLVESFLASPRFGEHQARYWLDAVRYGDTHGLHLDNRRGIFPYRDWVVRAFNDNLPLDDFILWQVAGDLLAHPTMEQLVATGFVRMNPTTSEGGVLPEEFQAKNNFDRTETFGTVFLGMSLNCARCHTHKYDPIPQTEYYQLLAFFNSTAEKSLDGNAYEYGPVLKVPADQAAWAGWHNLEAEQARLIQQADHLITSSEVNLLPPQPEAQPESSNPVGETGKAAGESDTKDTSSETSPAQSDTPSSQPPPTPWSELGPDDRLALVANPEGPFKNHKLQEAAQGLRMRMEVARTNFTPTLVARDLENPRPTHVLRRGEYNLPTGEPLAPGILSVMGPLPENAPRNRLGLAQWLISRDHPLVARVLVNRIWQRTFGYGLVRTPEDFGLQGQQPTHPELLDWLAVELQDSGWDLKHMLRLMVHSRTFRQSSARRPEVDDPENRLYARGPSFRLDAEVLRDIGLWASGLLDTSMGGEGVKPYQPPGMWFAMAHPASNTKRYVQDQGSKLYRRSLYVYWKRTSPHPMMTLFDAPSRETSCVRRSRTNTSLQSLGLLNETQRLEMSRMLAERLLREAGTDQERLDFLFTLLASRPPTDDEADACRSLLQTMRQRYAQSEQDALALLSYGDAPRDSSLNPVEHAAWSQLATIALASDAAILLY